MPALTPTQFETFSSLIYSTSGIRLPLRKMSLLQSRIERRMKAININGLEDYCKLVHSRPGRFELTLLLDEVTTNETSFFRTQSHFKWFGEEFLPLVRSQLRKGERTDLRIWSAACSVGAEAYTAAMIIESQRIHLRNLSVCLLGTDISPSSIDAAKTGRFKKRLLDGVPPEWLNRYFKVIENGGSLDQRATEYQIRENVRSMARFETHNLMQPLPPGPRMGGPFDCVFLRNVLIYFDPASKQSVLDHVIATLRPGGFLVVGPSEGIYGMRNPLEKLTTFLYRKS